MKIIIKRLARRVTAITLTSPMKASLIATGASFIILFTLSFIFPKIYFSVDEAWYWDLKFTLFMAAFIGAITYTAAMHTKNAKKDAQTHGKSTAYHFFTRLQKQPEVLIFGYLLVLLILLVHGTFYMREWPFAINFIVSMIGATAFAIAVTICVLLIDGIISLIRFANKNQKNNQS